MSTYLASFLASLSEDEPAPRQKRSKPVEVAAPATAETVTPVTPSPSGGVTEKDKQNQCCNTCNTCNTQKEADSEQRQAETHVSLKAVPPSDEHERERTRRPDDSVRLAPLFAAEPSELEQIAEWRASVAAVASELPDIVKLKEVSLCFLDSPDALEAVANEWNAVSLFGMHEGNAPKERIDCWGLVLFLAWGVHRATVETIDQKVCALRTRSGAVQSQPRLRANFDQAVPWWQHPGITNTIKGRSDE